jgi:hypothetical protein
MVILPADYCFASIFPRKIENSWPRFVQQGNPTERKLLHSAQLFMEKCIMNISVRTGYLFPLWGLLLLRSAVALGISSCDL